MNFVISFLRKIFENDETLNFQSLNDCTVILEKWLKNIDLSLKEELVFESELLIFDQQLIRCRETCLKIAIFGKVGVGKSSLLNALLKHNIFDVSIRNGSTSREKYNSFSLPSNSIKSIEFVDTPGITNPIFTKSKQIGIRTAQRSDLILFVIDSDITAIDKQLLEIINYWDKPILFILNRIDNYSTVDKSNLFRNIHKRLPHFIKDIELLETSAAPRQTYLSSNGRTRSFQSKPQINSLEKALYRKIDKKGQGMIAMNILQEAHYLNYLIRRWRLQEGKHQAQDLAGYYAILKAAIVVANPVIPLDLMTVFFIDIYLVLHLCQSYNLMIDQLQLKKIIYKISTHVTFLGVSILSLQLILRLLKEIFVQFDLIDYSFLNVDSVLSIVIQVFLAIYTTYSVANLTVKYLLRSSYLLPSYFEES